MPSFFDNINSKVVDDLKVSIKDGSKLSIASACFSIYAFEELKLQLQNIDELRFIFTAPSFIQDAEAKQRREFYIPRLDRERTLYGSQFEVKLRNQLTQKAIALECADWIREKVKFKSNVTSANMQGFINISNEEHATYTPVNGFTTTDLGCEKGNNICNFVVKVEAENSKQYLRMFNELWNDDKQFADVTEQVVENISNIYKENSPEFIYFVALYNIFNEFLEDISEDVLPNEATGFKESQIWNKLYDFQKDAALAIINKLEKYNGCILADSVGLGKTFTALSVIKYYENRNKSVLVLCPKKLNDNWVTYRSNYINNPIAKDRLRYDILFHSDLSRNGGYSNGLDLSHVNWGNYDLVVIDESHNFRNGGKITAGDVDEDPLHDTGFRVLKLDTSNMQDVYYKPEEFSEMSLFEDNVKPDRTPEDLLFQVMLECNLPLSAKIERKTIAGKEVFNVNNGYLLACFDEDVNETVITEVAKLKPYYFIMRDKSLSSDNVADNFEQIFNAYSKDTIRKIL